MEIKISEEKGRVPVTVIHVDGNIDSGTYETFITQANQAIQKGARHILVDLTRVRFVSSAGLRALNEIFIQLRTLTPDQSEEEIRKGINEGTYKSPHLKLLNPSRETMTSLESSGFNMFIEIFRDLKTAVASF